MAEESKPDLVNAALLQLGEARLQAGAGGELPDEFDDIGQAVWEIYDQAHDEALYGIPWPWTLTRTRLEKAAAAPPDPPFENAFIYPESEIGNLRGVYEDTIDEPRTDGWIRQGNRLFASFDPVLVEYQRRVGEAAWPVLFRAAFVLLLCSRFAPVVTGEVETARHYERLYDAALRRAAQVDAQARPTRKVQIRRLADARFRGG